MYHIKNINEILNKKINIFQKLFINIDEKIFNLIIEYITKYSNEIDYNSNKYNYKSLTNLLEIIYEIDISNNKNNLLEIIKNNYKKIDFVKFHKNILIKLINNNIIDINLLKIILNNYNNKIDFSIYLSLNKTDNNELVNIIFKNINLDIYFYNNFISLLNINELKIIDSRIEYNKINLYNLFYRNESLFYYISKNNIDKLNLNNGFYKIIHLLNINKFKIYKSKIEYNKINLYNVYVKNKKLFDYLIENNFDKLNFNNEFYRIIPSISINHFKKYESIIEYNKINLYNVYVKNELLFDYLIENNFDKLNYDKDLFIKIIDNKDYNIIKYIFSKNNNIDYNSFIHVLVYDNPIVCYYENNKKIDEPLILYIIKKSLVEPNFNNYLLLNTIQNESKYNLLSIIIDEFINSDNFNINNNIELMNKLYECNKKVFDSLIEKLQETNKNISYIKVPNKIIFIN